jgi:NAD(P)-dependent dehydrogenase (short-subunit alcohol dehydrogenase family)
MQTVCITGTSRGIGLGFARAYLEQGDQVFGTVRDLEAPGVRELQKSYPERFIPVAMELSNRRSVEAGARKIQEHSDRIDILINNAGMNTKDNERRVEDISEQNIERVFNVNVLGPLRVLQALMPLLRAGNDAKAVMISSTAGSIARQQGGRVVPYCVSKAGLNMLTKLLYFHLKEEGIPTVALHPGWVRTDMGGESGALSIDESVAAMMKIIDELTTESAVYLDYSGQELPW